MAAAAKSLLITVDQYRQLPEREDVIQELHWGRVVSMTWPKMKHIRLQHRFVDLLRPLAGSLGFVGTEVPFRALPEYDLRGADVAFVSKARWDATSDDDNLHGSPELVIEVLSPSNRKSEIREKAALYLSTGSLEFWVVDPKRRTITVTHREGETIVYRLGQQIPIAMFAAQLDVSVVFE